MSRIDYRKELSDKCQAAMNRLCKWRTIFVGWQLGTRVKGYPEAEAISDLREVNLLMRVELNALTALLLNRNIIGQTDLQKQIIEECGHLELALQKKFPGFKSADDGMIVDVQIAKETTKSWPK